MNLKVPTQWNELTDKQLIKIANLYFSQKPIPTVVFDERLFKILAGSKWWLFLLRRKINTIINNVPFSELKKYYPNFYENQNLTRFVECFKIGKTKMYAPLDRLGNLTIGEFSVAEDLFLGFQNNAENKEQNYGFEYLQYLTALLYVESNSPTRPQFVKTALSEKVKRIKKIKPQFVFAVALSYKGCKDYLASLPKYKKIFAPKSTSSKSKKQATSSGLGNLILAMSGKTFGDYQSTFNTNIYTFLDNYVREIGNSQKLKMKKLVK